jgi:hypothetical protein
MIATKIIFNKENKGEFSKNPPTVKGQRFSCAGENCLVTETCEKWNHIYLEKYSTCNN